MAHRYNEAKVAAPRGLSLADISALYPDEAAAHGYFVKTRWPSGVRCAHCGSDSIQALATKRARPIWKCLTCGKQFSVTTEHVMEDSHIPLRKWLFGFFLLSGAKKGISSLQLSREIGISPKAAWFMAHRIRLAMSDPGRVMDPMYGVIEADFAFLGGKRHRYGRGFTKNKIPIHGVVERGGRLDTVAHPRGADPLVSTTSENITDRVIPDESVLMTDETSLYDRVGKRFVSHEKVNHGQDEYVRGEVHTNTVEGAFANLKRQYNGTHHHFSEKYAPKYLDEFDFKYNRRDASTEATAEEAIRGGVGKRVQLFRSETGTTPALRARTQSGPAIEPWKAKRGGKRKRKDLQKNVRHAQGGVHRYKETEDQE